MLNEFSAVSDATPDGFACVYGLVDGRDDLFYVGVTGNAKQRLKGHLGKRDTGVPCTQHIALHGIARMVILEPLIGYRKQSPDVHEREWQWIERLSLLGFASANTRQTPLGSAHSKDSAGKRMFAENRRLRTENARLLALLSTSGGKDSVVGRGLSC